MPKGKAIRSPKQFRLMEGIKHGSIKGVGPSPEVATKLLKETTESRKKRFAKSPMMKGATLSKGARLY